MRGRFPTKYTKEVINKRLWPFFLLCAIDKDTIFKHSRFYNTLFDFNFAKVACLEPNKLVVIVQKAEELRIRNYIPSYAVALIAIAAV